MKEEVTHKVVRINGHDCTIRTLHLSGDYEISVSVSERRRYSGYALKEAICLFKNDETINWPV